MFICTALLSAVALLPVRIAVHVVSVPLPETRLILFQQFNAQALQSARLDKRLVFELDNPIAPQGPGSGQNECRDASATLRRAK